MMSTSTSMVAPSIALKGVTVAVPTITAAPEGVEDAKAAAEASKARTAVIRLAAGMALFATPALMMLAGTVLAG